MNFPVRCHLILSGEKYNPKLSRCYLQIGKSPFIQLILVVSQRIVLYIDRFSGRIFELYPCRALFIGVCYGVIVVRNILVHNEPFARLVLFKGAVFRGRAAVFRAGRGGSVVYVILRTLSSV